MATKETLTIENFGGIKHAEIELSRVNVFIGPQATGKSVAAKLLYFFRKSFEFALMPNREEMIESLHDDARHAFVTQFPTVAWPERNFVVKYCCNDVWIGLERDPYDDYGVRISYSDKFSSLFNEYSDWLKKKGGRSEQVSTRRIEETTVKFQELFGFPLANKCILAPERRGLIPLISSRTFALSEARFDFGPYLIEFGKYYQRARDSYKAYRRIIESIGIGSFEIIDGRDHIRRLNGDLVPLEYGSSGQQEAMPLAVTVAGLYHGLANPHRLTLIVEEPDTHLFPITQKAILCNLLLSNASYTNARSSSQLLITTHSPYVLTALNNLIYAEQVSRKGPKAKKQIAQVMGDAPLIPSDSVRAYAFGNGTVSRLLSEETGLVLADAIDDVSEDLAAEFDAIGDIEFEKEAA